MSRMPRAGAHFAPTDNSQLAQFWRAHDKVAGLNEAFMEMLRGPHPLTPDEIRRLIDKNPQRYGRFEGFATPKPATPVE